MFSHKTIKNTRSFEEIADENSKNIEILHNQFKGLHFGFGFANSLEDMLTQMENMLGKINIQEIALNRDELINYHGKVSLRQPGEPIFKQWEIYGEDHERLASWGIDYVNGEPYELWVETLRGEQYCRDLLEEKIAEYEDRGEVEDARITYEDEPLDLFMEDQIDPLLTYTILVTP